MKISKNRAKKMARAAREALHKEAKNKKEYDLLLRPLIATGHQRPADKGTVDPIASGVVHRKTKYYPSHNSSSVISGTKKESIKYSGEVVIGLATTHKSNIIPVISKEQAIDIANMRRGSS